MFRKVIVANRGEIACRIIRTLRRMGVGSVAVYSDADRYAPHVLEADQSIRLGPAPVTESYLNQGKLLAASRECGADAIHPGYGFLSENAAFAQACADADLVFIGPTAAQIQAFGLKHEARDIAARADMPLLPGSGLLSSAEEAKREASRIGYPIMLKSSAGGGGIGMQLVTEESELAVAFDAVERLARRNFGRGGLFLERYIEHARHIEVQIFGNGLGEVIALGERDCSVQRRNQKVIEETPAIGLSPDLRRRLHDTAIRLGRAVSYKSAGTVEFVYDVQCREFYFLEVNTRLQVEHCITEEVTGIDLVEWMVRVAANEELKLIAPAPSGASIQARIYAEDATRGFRPSSGTLTRAQFPAEARVETWVEDGTEITPYYDPLLAKIIVAGVDREAAVEKLRCVLNRTQMAGIETNLDYLRELTASDGFAAGGMTTRTLDTFAHKPRTVEVQSAGTQTTIQDYPGRMKYWNVGVPPSGPMDSLSFRLANRAVGNRSDAAALEITMSGPTLKFDTDALICLAGASMTADIDGLPIEFWTPIPVQAGATLRVGGPRGGGCRTYLAVRGGFDVPLYLGSRATFTLGKFGGHGGRALMAGDILHVCLPPSDGERPRAIPVELRPAMSDEWEIGVLDGPHGAPDFFTEKDIETFYTDTWAVHYNSSRTGVRLIGPKPRWSRSDGGEAGLHPSNIHDTAYAIGAVDFTGDMPVILGPDGPSLGGFVCPATLVKTELWKLGQLRPGDRVRFLRLTPERALELDEAQESRIATLTSPVSLESAERVGAEAIKGSEAISPVLANLPAQSGRPAVIYRRAGDCNVLVEYGPMVLDLELRLHVHALMCWLDSRDLEGILDLTPGIRSLQVHYDSRILPLERLLTLLIAAEGELPSIDDIEVPTRIVELPLSWDDDATQLAIAKYMQSVRADAPWCPSNIEFIRRINGLESIDEVKRIVFEASYMVLGLGDVYLGAPVATPLDPRHRLVTTKYNPARTWTPENAVGIGGAYLCVYGMEGPGGYQFIGRTCQMWNTYKVTGAFAQGRPWLLRFFDQIRFYPVSAGELLEFRADFLHGRSQVKTSDSIFRLRDYRRFLSENRASIDAHKVCRQAAFEAERSRWQATGEAGHSAEPTDSPQESKISELPPDCIAVSSPVSGNVWRICATQGQFVKAGETLVLVESMKMEVAVIAPADGIVSELRCTEGRAVLFAQTLLVLHLNDTRVLA
jgi:urea carboxylase